MKRKDVLSKLYDVAGQVKETKMTIAVQHEDDLLEFIRSSKLTHVSRKILGYLLEHETLNQRSMAKLINVSSQSVSETIKKLLDKQLIIKQQGVQKNENFISLTPLGRDVAKRLGVMIEQHAEEVFKSLNDEEVDLLYTLLSQVVKR